MPTQERKNEIEKIVDGIVSEYAELNVPAFDITKFLNEKYGFAIASQPMVDDTTGMLFVDDDNFVSGTNTHRLVVINSLLSEKNDYIQRRRFITAHEFAHFILHKNDTRQYAHRDTSKREKPEEKEADYFARCLLMPKSIIETALNVEFIKNSSHEDKVALIARIFNVTKKKARTRLEEDLCYNA